MSKGAYYNEFDPAAAAWLRELIANNLIAPGDVDERSIKDVRSDDLRGYSQHHWFAGIGLWSAALRRSGWDDARPIWTGSCPCQPFSAAGKGLGFDDPRHLWPDWFRLIRECRPHTVVGEQVASAGLWLDLVQSDLEGLGFAFGAADVPAAGFAQGAHIRQRIYWVADRDNAERWSDLAGGHFGDWPQTGRIEGYGQLGAGDSLGGLADGSGRVAGDRELQSSGQHGLESEDGIAGRLGHHHQGSQRWHVERIGSGNQCAIRSSGLADGVDWLFCQDQRIRPVEAGAFPLAASSPGRLGLLRGYGNGLDLETAVNFVSAYMEAADIRDTMSDLV